MMVDMRRGVSVSVIIPVYNVEKYLDACVASVVEQSFKDIEIILVNDKSTDNSKKLCDDWAKRDKRIKVIHKLKNEGVNMARFTGFMNSHGKYVAFLDSDDILHTDNLEKSLSAIIENGADVAAYAHHEFSDANEELISTTGGLPKAGINILQTKDEIARYAFFGDGNLPDVFRMTVWGKLYSRKVVEKVDWNQSDYRYYEDNFWIVQALLAANKLILLSDNLIYYRRNTPYNHVGPSLSGQLTGNTKDNRPVGYLEQVKYMFDLDTKLAKRYKVSNLQGRLEEKFYGEMAWRMDGLSRSGLLDKENNLEYVPEVWAQYRDLNARLLDENARLLAENASHLGIKRSARLLVGNLRRRIRRSLEDYK